MAGSPLLEEAMQLSIIKFSRALHNEKIEHFVF